MEIVFKNKKLQKEYSQIKLLIRRHGERRAKLINRRLLELRAAATLAVMRTLPAARCHELVGNRRGKLSVDIDHPYRLIFEPNHGTVPLKEDGGLDWNKVTSIKIISIEDTHD
jgi:plasmid maintenance system killer protein